VITRRFCRAGRSGVVYPTYANGERDESFVMCWEEILDTASDRIWHDGIMGVQEKGDG
jgi:hypothetical protein